MKLGDLVNLAEDVLGSPSAALIWCLNPHPYLGGVPPYANIEEAIAILHRVEHGVY